MSLHPPSPEQQAIVSSIKDHNVIVNAVAGSGKTTTALHIASSYPSDSILLLTYNKRLKEETRQRISALSLTNIEAHSYHAMCFKYFGGNTGTDKDILSTLKRSAPPRSSLSYSIIIIDEAQDITKLFCKFIHYILSHNSHSRCRLCMLGDRYQSIFTFNGADPRYLTLANKIFGSANSLPWVSLKLSVTFRVPSGVVAFINKFAMKRNYMKAASESRDSKPAYVVDNTFNIDAKFLINEFISGRSYGDIFVLAPSIKSDKTPVRRFANKLSSLGFPVFIPVSDDEKIDDSLISGKIVISTFHQVKGLERPLVIVFNFDNSYFEFFKKDENPTQCTNDLYVAMTRASESLVLIHHFSNKFLKFLEPTADIEKSVSMMFRKKFSIKDQNASSSPKSTTIADLTKYTPYDIIHDCSARISSTTLKPRCSPADEISMRSKSEQPTGSENVREINDIAVLLWHELSATGDIAVISQLSSIPTDAEVLKTLRFRSSEIKEKLARAKQQSPPDASDILYLANVVNMTFRGYVFKVNQISEYSWISSSSLSDSAARIESLSLASDATFNKNVGITFDDLYQISGVIDCESGSRIVKFISSKQTKPEILIQALIQKYCNFGFENSGNDCVIYNIATDELTKIEATMEDTVYILQTLLQHKFKQHASVSDDEFTASQRSSSEEKKTRASELLLEETIEETAKLSLAAQISDLASLLDSVNSVKPFESGFVLVLDTETTGFPKGPRNQPEITSNYDNARMIELAYQVYSSRGELKHQISRVIRPDGFIIKNTKIHGIKHGDAKKNGSPVAEVLREFSRYLESVGVVVAHNIDFDISIILSELHRLKENSAIESLKSKTLVCTMKQGAARFQCGRRIKLTKLYEKLFGKEFLQEHRALSDVTHCAECYWEMN
jgi:DNA polymerase III epsilon subunit-like protein